jgi:hypothetical protein
LSLHCRTGFSDWWCGRYEKRATLEFDRMRKSMSVIISAGQGSKNRLLVKVSITSLESPSHSRQQDRAGRLRRTDFRIRSFHELTPLRSVIDLVKRIYGRLEVRHLLVEVCRGSFQPIVDLVDFGSSFSFLDRACLTDLRQLQEMVKQADKRYMPTDFLQQKPYSSGFCSKPGPYPLNRQALVRHHRSERSCCS